MIDSSKLTYVNRNKCILFVENTLKPICVMGLRVFSTYKQHIYIYTHLVLTTQQSEYNSSVTLLFHSKHGS